VEAPAAAGGAGRVQVTTYNEGLVSRGGG
jgi:hypothetical protein